nr:molybdopterin-dependent oxidoreductase [Paenibacillus curdlanolyticus]
MDVPKVLDRLRKGYGRKLASLHAWNGWIIAALAVTGLVLLGGFWRGVLGEGRVWIKWIHIVVGLGSLLPVLFYLLLATKHWKQLKGRPWQRANVLAVLALLLGWLGSGILLWQFKAVGPAWSNPALVVHDLFTWIGLPLIIYHSITRTQWLKDANRRAIRTGNETASDTGGGAHPAAMPRPLYSRRSFIRGAIGVGLAVTIGPSFLRWLGSSFNGLGGAIGGGDAMERLLANDSNRMVPAPIPLAASAPPTGGGAVGHFRVYTVTPIPSFDNHNWSFTIDGLVDRKLSWNWEQFVKLKREVQVSDFHCVTGWSVYNNTWEGIPLKALLAEAGVQAAARTIKFYSGDGVYTDALTLEQAMVQMDDVIVAVLHDGKPIPSDLGGPVRLIVPAMYAYKSVKWLNRIELIADGHIGYWEQRGYDNDAWV